MKLENKLIERTIIETEDGSHSLYVPSLKETYHSSHGAIQEAEHIYIKDALRFRSQTLKELSVLEIGFGTGLNAFLSLKYGVNNNLKIDYTGIEKYPVNSDEIAALNYPDLIDKNLKEEFRILHSLPWEESAIVSSNFQLLKVKSDFRKMNLRSQQFDVVYFDAFGPDVQNELWTEAIFRSIYESMKRGGVLTTYSVKGSVRRTMKLVGFEVSKIPGPPGKREITRAIKR